MNGIVRLIRHFVAMFTAFFILFALPQILLRFYRLGIFMMIATLFVVFLLGILGNEEDENT